MAIVTVGMPVYNGEDYLRTALDSVFAQTLEDFHLIVRDNASTDGTLDILHEYRDPRLTVLRAEENGGAARNYNAVFEAADTRYFNWLAHDDLLEPDYLELCVAELERSPDLVGAYGRAILIDEDGAVTERYEEGHDLGIDGRFGRAASFLRWVRLCSPAFSVFRTSALAQTRLIEPYAASDMTLLYRLVALGPMASLDTTHLHRRVHPGMSLKANQTSQSVAAWFSSSTSGHGFPRTKLVGRLMRASLESPIPIPGRLGMAALVPAIWVPRQVRSVVRQRRAAGTS
ncbi:MAG: glycosyltransferase family 2 protein [Actinomycetota bacterium]